MTPAHSSYDKDQAIVALLADEFEWDDMTREAFKRHLVSGRSYAGGWPNGFEFICDHPQSALWRLKADHRTGPWALRMSFYGFNEVSQAHADELTRRIAAA